METRDLISIQILCKRYSIPVSFVNTLHDYNLIELTVENNDFFIHIEQIKDVDKMMRLYYDLGINFEGMDVIYNLLEQVNILKQKTVTLRNRLRLYEGF